MLSARQWLTDAVITGGWAGEMEAVRFLGDLYRDNAEPEAAAEFLARSASPKKLILLAEQVGDRRIPVRLDRREPWWMSEARIALAVAQADLLPDPAAASLLDELTDLVTRGRAGELIEPAGRGGLTSRATAGACALAHRGTTAQAIGVLELLAVDVPREPNHFHDSDNAHAAACVEIAVAHPTLAVPALTRLFELARNGADKAIHLTVDDRIRHLARGSTADGLVLPVLTTEQRNELRSAAQQLAEGRSPITQVLRHELTPEEPAAQQAARQARDRILSTPEPTPGQVEIGSHIVTDAFLASLLDEPDRTACIEKLLSIAEDSQQTAANRQDALIAAANLAGDSGLTVRSNIFPRAAAFLTGDRDGSAYDGEITGPAHPLSFFRFSGGTATLRGHGLVLQRHLS